MKISDIKTLNPLRLVKNKSEQNQPTLTTNETTTEDNGNKIKFVLAGLAVLGAAAAAGIAVRKGKHVDLSSIDFSDGSAFKKDGNKFSGIIKDILPNGDEIKLKYKNGELISSQRKGIQNFKKQYITTDGHKIVKKTEDGCAVFSDITEMAHQGKIKQTAIQRTQAEENAQKIAKEAQDKFNAPFEAGLSHKSAKESAHAFEQIHQKEIQAEALKRTKMEASAEIAAKKAQDKFNAPFEAGLSHKSAKESAHAFEQIHQKEIQAEALKRTKMEASAEIAAKKAQDKFNAPFEAGLSHKSAKESAQDLFIEHRKNSTVHPDFDDKGNLTKTVIKNKNGSTIEEIFDTEGNTVQRITKTPDGSVYYTSYHNGIKTVEKDGFHSYGTKITSHQGGKSQPIYREQHNLLEDSHKTVEHLEDGISKTTYTANGKTTVTYRDKKGNIIEEYVNSASSKKGGDIGPLDPGAEKVYEKWYIEYVKLCKKYGVEVRPCGVEGGAFSHYYELLQMEKGPEAWERYIKLQEYRSQYDDNAAIMQYLREFGGNDILAAAGFNKEVSKVLMKLDPETLEELIQIMQNKKIPANNITGMICEVLDTQSVYGYQDIRAAAKKVIAKYNKPVYTQASSWAHSTYQHAATQHATNHVQHVLA